MLENHMVLHLNEHLDRMFPSLEQQQAEQERIQEKANDLIDGDLIFEAIGDGPDSFDIDLINAVWAEDACEVGNLIMNRIKAHAKAEAEAKAERGEL